MSNWHRLRNWFSGNVVAIVMTLLVIAVIAQSGLLWSQRSTKKPDDVHKLLTEVQKSVESLAEDVEKLTATVDGEDNE